MSISVQKPKKCACPEIGEILYGQEYISRIEFPTKLLDGKRLVIPEYGYGWDGIKHLNIDACNLPSEVKYECPWTHNKFNWIYPIGIITSDETRYGYDHDAENIWEGKPWQCPEICEDKECEVGYTGISGFLTSSLYLSFVGHGYTEFTLPHDGSRDLVLATVPLDNGDELLCLCWIWYNK